MNHFIPCGWLDGMRTTIDGTLSIFHVGILYKFISYYFLFQFHQVKMGRYEISILYLNVSLCVKRGLENRKLMLCFERSLFH